MRHAQQGTSYLWMMVQVIIFILVAKAVFTIFPAFMQDRIINGQITDLMTEQPNISATAFYEKMNKRLEINAVRDLPFEQVAKVSFDDSGAIQVDTNYDVRKNFFSNIDFVIHFEKSFDQNSIKTQ